MPTPRSAFSRPRTPAPGDPLRVAFLIYRGNPHCGGQGVYSRHLTRELTELGHTVTMLAGPPRPVAHPPVTLEHIQSPDLYKRENPFRVPWPPQFRTRTDVEAVAILARPGLPEAH